jgi:hypothetical protein
MTNCSTDKNTIGDAAEKARLLAVHAAGAERPGRYAGVLLDAPIRLDFSSVEDRARMLNELLNSVTNASVGLQVNDYDAELHFTWKHVTKDGDTVYPRIIIT